jgi:hypothetical protein
MQFGLSAHERAKRQLVTQPQVTQPSLLAAAVELTINALNRRKCTDLLTKGLREGDDGAARRWFFPSMVFSQSRSISLSRAGRPQPREHDDLWGVQAGLPGRW